MDKEQMIEKIQEAEVTAWNDYEKAKGENGGYDGSTLAYGMKHRHAAIRDLMQELGIESKINKK